MGALKREPSGSRASVCRGYVGYKYRTCIMGERSSGGGIRKHATGKVRACKNEKDLSL
jgi:hypothetical protein